MLKVDIFFEKTITLNDLIVNTDFKLKFCEDTKTWMAYKEYVNDAVPEMKDKLEENYFKQSIQIIFQHYNPNGNIEEEGKLPIYKIGLRESGGMMIREIATKFQSKFISDDEIKQLKKTEFYSKWYEKASNSVMICNYGLRIGKSGIIALYPKELEEIEKYKNIIK